MMCDQTLLRQDLFHLSSLLSDSRIISKCCGADSGNSRKEDSSCLGIASSSSSIKVVIDDLIEMLDNGTTMVQSSSDAEQADRHIPAVSLTWIDVSPSSLQDTSHSSPLENVESLKILLHNTYCLWWMIVCCMNNDGGQHLMRDSTSSLIVTIDQMSQYMQYIYSYHTSVLQDVMMLQQHTDNR